MRLVGVARHKCSQFPLFSVHGLEPDEIKQIIRYEVVWFLYMTCRNIFKKGRLAFPGVPFVVLTYPSDSVC